MRDKHYLTAREAARELQISPATLYAYVSRGLVRSEEGLDKRSRLYLREDVEQLKKRKEQRRNPARVAEEALYWGAPVMESALTLIADGKFYYRGRDVLELATQRSFEEVAALLWIGEMEAEIPAFTAPVALSSRCRQVLVGVQDARAVEAFQIALAAAAVEDLAAYDLSPPAVVQTGARILRQMVAVVAGEGSSGAIARLLQQTWVPHRSRAESLINAALILSADHELNVSAFTARCVSSAKSTPYAVVLAGLAALLGTRHGGASELVAVFLREVERPENVRSTIASRLKRGETIPGFGHRLYPQGDPRGRLLLKLTAEAHPGSPAVELAAAAIAEVEGAIGKRPNLDFGLAILCRALGLADDAPLTLFALGRTAGWIGHALEQYQSDRFIRPRARYVGERPGD